MKRGIVLRVKCNVLTWFGYIERMSKNEMINLPTYLPTYLHAHIHTYMHTYINR